METGSGSAKLDCPNLGDFLRIKEGSNAHYSVSNNNDNDYCPDNQLITPISNNDDNQNNQPITELSHRVQLNRSLLDVMREDSQMPSRVQSDRTLLDIIQLSRMQSNRSLLDIVQDDILVSSRVQSNRTLMDIIQAEYQRGGAHVKDSRRSWKNLKDKFRLRRSRSDPVSNNNRPTRRSSNSTEATQLDGESRPNSTDSTQLDRELTSSLRRSQTTEAAATVEEAAGASMHSGDEGRGDQQQQPARMSLMALLTETERQGGVEGLAYVMVDEEDEEDVTGHDGNRGGGGGGGDCCICMVRNKGAAFIPCGHTFCRPCSRELWVQRGNCPICNNHIVEVLDIF